MPVSVHIRHESARRERIFKERAVLGRMNTVAVVVNHDLEELRLDVAVLARMLRDDADASERKSPAT